MRGLKALVAFALIATIALGLAGFSTAQPWTEVHDIGDSYDKVLDAGGEVQYEWLVFNAGNSSVLLTTRVDPSAGPEWSASLEPTHILIQPEEGVTVRLTVSSTESLADGSATYTVTFTSILAADPGVSEAVPKTAQATLVAAPPLIPPENKIVGVLDNPLPAPFNDRWVTFSISIGIWAGFAVLALLIISPILHRYAEKTETQLDDIVLGIIRGPVFILVIAYGMVHSLAILTLPKDLIEILFLIYNIIFLLILTWMAMRIFKGIIVYYGERLAAKTETHLDDILIPVLNKVGAILIIIIGLASIAALFGMDLTAVIAGMGVLGIAIAFAAQESLANFFSGMFLMLDRPFKEGDLIEVNGDRCRIEKIGLRSTRLYHRPSSKILVVPNNKLARDMIVNLVEPDEAIRQSTTVGVPYGSDIEKVKAILADAAREHPNVVKGEPRREPYARLEEFGDSAMVFKLKFWINDADMINKARGQVNEIISKRLKEAGIELPYPTRTIHIMDWSQRTT